MNNHSNNLHPTSRLDLIIMWSVIGIVVLALTGIVAITTNTKQPEPSQSYTLLSKPFDTGGGTVVAIRLENRVEGFANKGDTVYILKLNQ